MKLDMTLREALETMKQDYSDIDVWFHFSDGESGLCTRNFMKGYYGHAYLDWPVTCVAPDGSGKKRSLIDVQAPEYVKSPGCIRVKCPAKEPDTGANVKDGKVVIVAMPGSSIEDIFKALGIDKDKDNFVFAGIDLGEDCADAAADD